MMARRVLHDHYFKQAKAEGYLARSAYKLLQIQESRRIIRRGDHVLDLGCAPGSWLQVAAELVGDRGRVVGIDLKPVEHAMPANVTHLVGDIQLTDAAALLGAGTSTPDPARLFDVVLSDMAPNTSGHGDSERSIRLCRRVLDLLPALLRTGGNLAIKALEGGEYPALLRDTSRLFAQCKGFKPEASRDVSKEMYIVALGYKPPTPPRDPHHI